MMELDTITKEIEDLGKKVLDRLKKGGNVDGLIAKKVKAEATREAMLQAMDELEREEALAREREADERKARAFEACAPTARALAEKVDEFDAALGAADLAYARVLELCRELKEKAQPAGHHVTVDVVQRLLKDRQRTRAAIWSGAPKLAAHLAVPPVGAHNREPLSGVLRSLPREWRGDG